MYVCMYVCMYVYIYIYIYENRDKTENYVKFYNEIEGKRRGGLFVFL